MFLLRRFSLYLALAGFISISLLVLRLRSEAPVPPPPVPPPAKPSPRAVAAYGLVESVERNTDIGVPLTALVTAVHVREWDRVQAGQVLLQLDDRELRSSTVTQSAQVAVAEAERDRIQAQLERIERLAAANPGAVTEDERTNRRLELAVAQARIAAARAQLEQTAKLLERLTIHAPAAGVVLQVNTRVGETVAPGRDPAPIVIGQIDALWVRCDVDEQLAPRVRPHRPAIGYLKGETTQPIPLEFVRIEPFVVPKRNLTGSSLERVDTRVLQVIYRFPSNPARPVYVGQQLEVYIEE